MGTFTGDVDSGYVGSLAVAVDTTTEAGAGSAPGGGGGAPGGDGAQPPTDGEVPTGTPPDGAPEAPDASTSN